MFRTFTVDGGVNGTPNLLKNYMQINMANVSELIRMVVNDCAKEHDFDANYTYNKLYNNESNKTNDFEHIENSQNVCTKRGRPTKERRVTETGSPNNLFDGLMNDNLYNNTTHVLGELEEDTIDEEEDTIDEEEDTIDEEEDTIDEDNKEEGKVIEETNKTKEVAKEAINEIEKESKKLEKEKKEADKEAKKLEKEKKEADKEAKKLEKEKKEADKESKKLEKEKKEADKEAKKLEKEKKEADKEAKKLEKEKKKADKESKKLEKEKKKADKELLEIEHNKWDEWYANQQAKEEEESVKVYRIFENGTTVSKGYEGNEKIYYKSKTNNDIYSKDGEKIGVFNGTTVCLKNIV